MIVKISNYGLVDGKHFVKYKVSQLELNQINFLKNNLNEQCDIVGDDLVITMYFSPELYPFQSDVAKVRLDDFIAREEIEMNIFLSSFLEDL